MDIMQAYGISLGDLRWRLGVDAIPNGECILWTRARDRDGYGQIKVGGRKGVKVATHRLAYQLYRGEIPEGLYVLHTCDVRNCINPEHLYLGTQANNVQDTLQRGRMHTVLTEDMVRYIRESEKSSSWLARKFGVSESTVHKARRGTSWKYVR